MNRNFVMYTQRIHPWDHMCRALELRETRQACRVHQFGMLRRPTHSSSMLVPKSYGMDYSPYESLSTSSSSAVPWQRGARPTRRVQRGDIPTTQEEGFELIGYEVVCCGEDDVWDVSGGRREKNESGIGGSGIGGSGIGGSARGENEMKSGTGRVDDKDIISVRKGCRGRKKKTTEERFGIVDDILMMGGDNGVPNVGEQHQMLLKVVRPIQPSTEEHITLQDADARDDGRITGTLMIEEEHLIPLVKSIVPRIDPVEERVFIKAPEGLLDLGRRKAQMDILRCMLQPIAESLSKSKGLDYIIMPTQRELDKLGRRDVVKLIQEAGGFLEVAQTLRYVSTRRPPGYWEDETVLDRELSLFVGASWVEFLAGDDDEEVGDSVFRADDMPFSNMILPSSSNPVTLEKSGTDDGLHISTDDEKGKINYKTQKGHMDSIALPSQSLETAGKQPSSHQQTPYWFNTVTRRMRWDPPVLPQLVELDDQGSELFAESDEDRAMPSRSAILAAGRYDLHSAIVAAGGYTRVAEMLDRWPAWPPTKRFKNEKILKTEIKDFVEEHDLPRHKMPAASDFLDLGRPDLHQGILRNGGYTTVAQNLGFETHRLKRGKWKDFEFVCKAVVKYAMNNAQKTGTPPRVPTHEELRRAGRHDLRHALQKYGSKKVSEATGLPMSSRGGKSRVNMAFRKELEQEFQKFQNPSSHSVTDTQQ